MSDDGCHSLTIIAFVGSVFSPYYSNARRRGATDPANHCALNVALYGKGGKRWALTERNRNAVERQASSFSIGPSEMFWDRGSLVIRIDEMTFPIPSRIRGTVRIHPTAISNHAVALDLDGRHWWSPLSPRARIEVELSKPALRWSGTAYLDTNSGEEPLEEAFVRWNWSRAMGRDNTFIMYDIHRHQGDDLALALSCNGQGDIELVPPPPSTVLPPSAWKIPRSTRADPGHPASVSKTLEDTPFYTRSMLTKQLYGEPVTAIHESLCLNRYRSSWVRQLIPFRMPRSRS